MSEIDVDNLNASISFNDDFYCFLRFINHGLLIPDYLFGMIITPASAEVNKLGSGLRQVITRSECINSEHPYVFDHKINKDNYEKNIKKQMNLCGYKNKKELFKNMKKCYVSQVEDIITIRPSNHVKLEAWSGECISETDWVIIPASASDEELGHAIIEGFSRCRGRQF